MEKTILSASHKASIAKAMTGKKQSAETIQKRKEALKKTYEKRKKSVSPK